jgi:hypothetical protein
MTRESGDSARSRFPAAGLLRPKAQKRHGGLGLAVRRPFEGFEAEAT